MTGGNSIDVVLHDLTENPALEGSSSCFSTGDLLNAPLDDSQGELDDFEPTPLPNRASRPTPSTNTLFEPTPMRTLKPQLVKPVAPTTAHQFPRMFPQHGVAPHNMMQQQRQQQQQPMLNQPPQNLIQAQQLQAALANLRRVNQMGQQHLNQQQPNMVSSSMQQQQQQQQQQPTQLPQQMMPSQQVPLPQQPQVPNGQAFSSHAPSPQPRGFSRSPPPPRGNLKAYSTAMEKLCETMKRSAMSRNMVKQLSGRNLSKQGSQRNLTKQGSQRSLVKQNSGRDLGALARQASGRNLTHSPTPCEAPLRRSLHDSKHRIAREALMGGGGSNHGATTPNTKRGLFRHNSSSALMGNKNRGTQMQLDDCHLGYLFDDALADRANSAFPPTRTMAL